MISATELLRRTGEVPGLAKIMARLGMEGRESFGEAAAAIEFVLEGPVPDPPPFLRTRAMERPTYRT